MKKINLVIIGGGTSSEREVSLKTSRQIALSISQERYNVSFLEITTENKWLLKNAATLLDKKQDDAGCNEAITVKSQDNYLIDTTKIDGGIDLVFIALHGKNGEDGRVQAVFDLLGIPYTGSGILASALGMDKEKCALFVKSHGIITPKSLIVEKKDWPFDPSSKLAKKQIDFPYIVKPNESGSSVGVSLVTSSQELSHALDVAFKEDSRVIIEECIKGREFTCGVIGNTGQTEILSLPVTEIITPESEFFDYEAKYYSQRTEEICPANIPQDLKEKIQTEAITIHKLLGCDGLTRSDFIFSSENDQLYFLEINTIPGQTEASLCPKEARAMGWTFEEFIEKQMELALKKMRK